MTDNITANSITNNFGQSQRATNTSRPETKINSPQELRSSSIDLGKLSRSTTSQKTTLVTVEDLKQQKITTDRNALRNKSMTAMTLAGGGFSALAGFAKMFFGEDSALAKALDSLTDKVSSLTFTGFGAFGSRDSVKRNYLPQVIPQVLGMITPWLVKSGDLTMYRGVEVGLANVAADVEKLGGGKKDGYKDFSESIGVLKNAASKYAQAMKENPLKAALNYESGTAGITTGLVTAFSPLLHLLGLKKAAALLRQGSGIAVEFASKFNMDNLNKGRYALFASGGLMTVSSFLNLVKEFLPQQTHKAVENFTWAFNLFGKQAQLQAYNNGEMALTHKQNYTLSELPGKMLRAVLGQTSTEATLEDSGQLKQQKEVKPLNTINSSNGYSSLRMPSVRQSFVPRANLSTNSASSAPTTNYNKSSRYVIQRNPYIESLKTGLRARSISGKSFAGDSVNSTSHGSTSQNLTRSVASVTNIPTTRITNMSTSRIAPPASTRITSKTKTAFRESSKLPQVIADRKSA